MLDAEWLNTFKGLHEMARQGALAGLELQYYMLMREQLAEAVLAPMHAKRKPGTPARRTVRVTKLLPIDLELPDGWQRIMTRSLSGGGFGGLLADVPGPEPLLFSLQVSSGLHIAGRAEAVSAQARTGAYLVSFRFLDLTSEEIERIQTAVFDCVLSRLLPST